ncbi:MAG: hypothetical protein ACOX7F_02720 [Eubacteriales bacterium]
MKEIKVLSDRKIRDHYCPVIRENVVYSYKNTEKYGHSCDHYPTCGQCTNRYVREDQG